MRKLALSLAFTIGFSKLFAQYPPGIEWQKSLGGSYVETPHSIEQTTDGGYIVAGNSWSIDGDISGNHGDGDYWIVKLDSFGNLIWQKSLGGTDVDLAYSIHQTTDGGYIVAGETYSDNGDVSGQHNHFLRDYWVVKLDTSGNIVWQKCLGGSGDDEAYSVQQTADGGYIVAGRSTSNNGDVTGWHQGYYSYDATSDSWIVKLDANGNMVWQKSLGGTNDDVAYSIQQTNDGGYIVAGSTASNDGDVSGNHYVYRNDDWVVKLDSFGNIVWQKCLGGSGGETAYSVQQTTDEGYIVAGISLSNDGDVSGNHGSYMPDYWVVKLDESGNIKWQKCLGGTNSDWAYSIQQTTDGGFVVAGYTNSNDGDVSINIGSAGYWDVWIVKLDTAGNLDWQKSYGGSSLDEAFSINNTSDGGYIVAGISVSNDGDVSGNHGDGDYWIVKLSCNATQLYFADGDSDGYGNASAYVTGLACMAPPSGYSADSTDCNDNNPNIHPHASEIPNNGIDDNCNGLIDELPVGIPEISSLSSLLTLSPNPAANFITLHFQSQTGVTFNATITITNLLGKTVFEKTSRCSNGNLQEAIPLDEKFAEGIYLVRVSSEQQQWSAPLVIAR